METRNTKKILVIAIAAALIIGLGAILYRQGMQDTTTLVDTSTTAPPADTNTNEMPPETAPQAILTSSGDSLPEDFPRQPDTYQIAIDNYNKGSRLLQFENCEARPIVPMFAFAGGTEIMIDGKSPDPQTVYIFGKVIELQGYDFEFITVPKVTSAQTYKVDCSISGTRSYNVADLVVQP